MAASGFSARKFNVREIVGAAYFGSLFRSFIRRDRTRVRPSLSFSEPRYGLFWMGKIYRTNFSSPAALNDLARLKLDHETKYN